MTDGPIQARALYSWEKDDARERKLERKLREQGFSIESVRQNEVYTIAKKFDPQDLDTISGTIACRREGVQKLEWREQAPEKFDWAIEVGFLPGVTDNVGTTARTMIQDALGAEFREGEQVYTSTIYYLTGNLSEDDAHKIAGSFINPIIQRVKLKNFDQHTKEGGMDVTVPFVKLDSEPEITEVDLHVPDEELIRLGKEGIPNKQRGRNGPLALEFDYLYAIRDYFDSLGRNPTDVELESIAQTWSEHCKHTIFRDQLDEIKDGLFKHYIKRGTSEIRARKGSRDRCVSVFSDNSGVIRFDENWVITAKVETHNSPSALDPFGGAITGIVGVDRDSIGAGKGAMPINHLYGFCVGRPEDLRPLYKGPNFTQKMLSPGQIFDGVIEGVKVGGNCSGIPTSQGFVRFDDRYRGKPLVYVGVFGLMPANILGEPSWEKQAKSGDLIVMAGGRVGKDGIHGATFSSEAMNPNSPAGAVQIGDPITQKKMSDALMEARDLGLCHSTTDNGAGGLSCSVPEMARECGGCYVELEKVPLKYSGLQPWEIWVSESQERMTLAVHPEKWEQFSKLIKLRGVEATVIGEFTDSGKCVVKYESDTAMDIDLEFLHEGLPKRKLKSTYTQQKHEEPTFDCDSDITKSLKDMVSRLNICSFEFISTQYDHEVQGGSVIKPLQGEGRVNGDATVVRPVLDSDKGMFVSTGPCPSYSDIDTYHMAACSYDTAVRATIAVGARLDEIYLLDNFCWCSSNEPERLGQLKRAAQASFDIPVAYLDPLTSGKDSMFNDFKGFDEKGNSIKISIPPTLLATAWGVIGDVKKCVSMDAKCSGDLIYVLGETKDELGGSEYFAMKGEKERGKAYVGNNVPKVNPDKNIPLYKALNKAIEQELIASCKSIDIGGLGVALAKTAIAGKLGLDVSLENLPTNGSVTRDDFALYSESQGRFVVTIAPQYKEKFESLMKGNSYACIGRVTDSKEMIIKGLNGKEVVKLGLDQASNSYRSTFRGYIHEN